MLRRISSVLILLSFVACSKQEPDKAASATTTGSADGSGSAMAGSGSDAAGSAAAGSGSAAGSAAGSGDGSAMAGSGSAAAGRGTEGDFDFDKLSHDDKVKLMKTKVMPAMKAAFQKFDPKEFANFTCKTCHGKDPQKVKFEMPTKELPALDFEKLKTGHDKEWVEFMNKIVKPEMAKILNEPEMTETNQSGFGCLHCHVEKKK